MALSRSATVGIIVAVGIILLLSLIAIYHTKRHSRHNTASKATNPSAPTDSDSPAPSSLLQLKNIDKRARFSDTQQQQQQQHHTRYPSLEHGPGSTLTTLAHPKTPSIDTIRAVITTPATSSSSTRVQSPTTAVSTNRSSLHQAMLDVSAEHWPRNDNDAVEEAEDSTIAKDLKHNPTGKAYTGAWPLRDVNGASHGR